MFPRWRGRIILSRDPDGERVLRAPFALRLVQSMYRLQKAKWKMADGIRVFRINFSRCIMLVFVKKLATNAIQLTPDFEMAEHKRQDMVWERGSPY